MADYISREAAKQRIRDSFPDLANRCEINAILNSISAADVRPVVRGKWEERRFSEDVYGAECSVCHTTWDYGTNFCPNCGADMREPNLDTTKGGNHD